jgi:GR25 family glycosyltransferase involved in LPS biosynthesis
MINIVLVIVILIILALITIEFKKTAEHFANNSPTINSNDMDVYLINLDRNKDRLEAFIEQYMSCDLRVHQIKRLSAVDGQTIENIEDLVTPKALVEIQEVQKTGYRTKHYQLTVGACGCYLSHLQVYELISKSDKEYGMIFEDDVVIDKNIFKKFNKALVNIPSDWDILLLSCHCIVCEKMDIYYNTGKFFWLHCYVVKKSSVNKIIDYLKSDKIGKQIDSELSDMIEENKLKVYCLKESLCKQGNMFQTTIQTPLKVVPGINPYANA